MLSAGRQELWGPASACYSLARVCLGKSLLLFGFLFLYLREIYSSEMRPEGRPWALGLDLRIRAQGGVGTTTGP